MHLRLGLVAVALSWTLTGCGLFLDTSPPDQAPDGGGAACSTDADCNDSVACTTDTCRPDGVCESKPDDALCEGDDLCAPGVGCADPCTGESDCDHLDVSVCGAGDCEFLPDGRGYCVLALDHGSCSDAYPCTTDLCGEDGQCTSTPSPAACDDFTECTVDACDPLNVEAADENGCTNTPSDALCTDAVACTLDLCRPEDSRAEETKGCVRVPDDTLCMGTGPGGCTVGVCTPALGCQIAVVDEVCVSVSGTHCDLTSGECTTIGTCGGGESCDDGNPCNGLEVCGPGGVCELSSSASEQGCTSSGDVCRQSFCESPSPGVYACEERPLPACFSDLVEPPV